MSQRRRREKAIKRATLIERHRRRHSKGVHGRCLNCGEIGPHFQPPSFGDPGFYMCEPDGLAKAIVREKEEEKHFKDILDLAPHPEEE